MYNIFTKFYSEHIKEIHDFLNSTSDVLYVCGFSGSGKSSAIKNALKTYDKEILNFHHLCFEGTVIDDFLLSFYDSFRINAIKGKITLKKNPEEEFMQKVNFYFKNLDCPAIVVIDNYEIVSNNSAISDFLLHISGFENVKIIIISKEQSCNLSENPTVSIEKLIFDKINIFEFEDAIKNRFKELDSTYIEKFYEATGGYELYLKMTLNYINVLNIKLEDFLDEYIKKEISFEEFVVEKQVSLIPNIYYPLLINLSVIRHNVSSKFIQTYSIGEIEQIPYLISKFALSGFFNTVYIKSYLRKYFLNNLSLQDKVNIPDRIISIYENELKKTPKDRILRLSRESIRNRIMLLNEAMPKIQKINPTPAFNYISQAITNNPQWFITGTPVKNIKKTQLSAKIEEKEQNKAETLTEFEKEFERASVFEKDYHYKEALEILIPLKLKTKNLKEKIKLYPKIATNYIKLNDNNSALTHLRELCRFCLDEGDVNSCSVYKIEIGKIYKKMYVFSRAKACFEEVKNKKNEISNKTLALACISLGDIFELENNLKSAITEYSKGFELILNSSGNKDILLPEICYKKGKIYDEGGFLEEALDEYKKSINFAATSKNNNYLIKCHANSGVILTDMGNTEDAFASLEIAYNLSCKTTDYLETSYIARNIARIYKNTDTEQTYVFLQNSLEYARLSDNSFEMAISLLELGDFYYDLKQNEQALICYFQAKNTLGVSASKENIEKITIRINDMKIKLGDYIFKGMQELYDKN